MHNKVFWLSKPFLIELFLVLEENKFNLENLLKLAFGTVILIVFVNYFRQQFYNNKIGLISKIKIFYSRLKDVFFDFLILIHPDNFDHRDEFFRIVIWILLNLVFYTFTFIIGIAYTFFVICLLFFIILILSTIYKWLN